MSKKRATLTMQVLEGGFWVDVDTRAKTVEGMKRQYKILRKENRRILGLRIITVHEKWYGILGGLE